VASQQTIEVRLPENPTTGYRWAISDHDQKVLPFQGDRFVSPTTQVGAGGTRVFEFQAAGAGSTTLRLKQFRAWEGDSSIIGKFEIKVNVK
jgi:inhibitor of cysteine peptidase